MISKLKGQLGQLVGGSPIGSIPVRIQHGPAKGARWTLLPFSHYWRSGGYEGDVPAALRLFSDAKGLVFWDIGAHYGIHSISVAMMVGAGGQVVSFEPDQIAFNKLSKHVKLNNLTNVKIFNTAASDVSGEASLYISGSLGSSNSFLKFHANDDTSKFRSVKIKTVRIDELVASAAIRPPNLIKLDVQGHGGPALEGARATLASALPVIAFSNHSWEELERSRAVLEPIGYRPQDYEGNPIEWGQISEAILVPSQRNFT